MTITYGFYNSLDGDRTYNATDISRMFDGLFSDGVFISIGTCLMVVESGGMIVNVGIGRAWFNYTWTYNDAIYPLTISEAESVLNRIDTVVLEVNSAAAYRANTIKIVNGTPATEPVAPTLENTTTLHQYPLAHIAVGAGVTEILQANITNKVGTTDCPYVTAILEPVDAEAVMAQWSDSFGIWFEEMKDQLSTDAAGNLQLQIDDLSDALDVKHVFGGRLTLTDGTPETYTDIVDATTIYWNPYGPHGGTCTLFNGTAWKQKTLTSLSLANTNFTASLPHDIFIDWNDGTPVLKSLPWTSVTARATSLVLQNGRYVLTGALDWNYIGTVYVDANKYFSDSLEKRYVWNLYNPITRYLYKKDETAHAYASATARYWNNDSSHYVKFVVGLTSTCGVSIYATAKASTDGYFCSVRLYDENNAATLVQVTNNNASYYNSGSQAGFFDALGLMTLSVKETGATSASSNFRNYTLRANLKG